MSGNENGKNKQFSKKDDLAFGRNKMSGNEIVEYKQGFKMDDLAFGLGGLLAGVGIASVVTANAVYKKCPPNKLLVIYGRGVSRGASGMRIVRSGGASVVPMLQGSHYMSLEPMSMEIPLKGALSLEKIRVNVPSVFTVAISTDEQTSVNAARRLLGMSREQIENQAEEVIVGQMRQVLAGLTIEEINRDRDKFVTQVQEHCCVELGKLGLELLNTNVQNITDESGVIDELGRKAAAEVTQQARIDVATQEKKGAIGVSQQDKDKDIFVGNNSKERDIGVREAERETRTRIEELEAEELQAVNLAREKKTESEATLAIARAGFQKQAEIARREAEAAVAEADANAKTRAALAQAEQVEAETRASLEAKAKAEKSKAIVDAEAKAEQINIVSQAEAQRVYTLAKAEARGNAQGLKEKAEGLKAIVDACGSSEAAYRLLLLEHIDKLAETSAAAISNIKFDKVVVWDGGNKDVSGRGAVPNFIKDVSTALPPTLDVLGDIAGVDLKSGLGQKLGKSGATPIITTKEADALTSDS